MKVNKRKVITKILSYMLVMALMIGLMPGVNLVAKAENSTETFSTFNDQDSTYIGNHFKLVCTGSHDSDGVTINDTDNKTIQITALNGETITQVKLTRCFGSDAYADMSQVRVAGKTYSQGSTADIGIFTGINSSSALVKVVDGTDKSMWINPIVVSYTTAPVVTKQLKVGTALEVGDTVTGTQDKWVRDVGGSQIKMQYSEYEVVQNSSGYFLKHGDYQGSQDYEAVMVASQGESDCLNVIDGDGTTSNPFKFGKKTDPEEPEEGDSNNKDEEVKHDDKAPQSEVEGLDDALLDGVLTDTEKTAVAAGQPAKLTLEMTNIDGSVNAEDKALTEKAAQSVNKNAQIGTYFDLSLLLTVGNSIRKVNNTGSKDLKFKLKVPEKYHAPKGVIRTFFIIRIHASKSDILAKTTSTTIPFSSSDFSTYALAYVDEPIKGFYPGLKISQKDGKIKVSWEKVEGAAKYAVFITYCGKDMPKKANTKVKTNKATIKKIGGKKIDFSKNMKMYVVAYDSSGNAIGKSVSAHFAGKDSKKHKNPKDIKLSTKNVSINVGGTANIKASVKMESGKKKALSTGHVAKLRYASSDISIATVDKSGKVTGVGAGTCTVYVYAQNGLAKKVTVTVN